MADVSNKEILSSWKDISNYLDRSIRTCHKWEKIFGLPIYRIDNKSLHSRVFTFKSEIDQWLKEKIINNKIGKKPFLENRWVIIGLLSCLSLLSIIFAFSYYTHKKTLLPSPENLSVAVFPFENLNSSEYDEYFSEGITNEIVNKLLMLKKIKVFPAISASKNKNTFKSAKLFSEELNNADYILKGKIKRDDKKIKLDVQLIRTKDNTTIWSAEFEDGLENILSIQDTICLKIQDKLNINVSQKSPISFDYGKTHDYIAFDNYLKGNYILSRIREDNNDPWKLYYQGKYYEGMFAQESNELAINLFNKAIEIDNSFAPAYIGLAQCYINYVNFKWDYNKKWLVKAEELIKIAQTIYADFPEYYSTSIEIYLLKEFCFNENTKKIAFELAQEGIKKYPNHPQLNSIVGYCYYLQFGEEGNKADFDKALEYKEKSFWLNPYDLSNITYAELLMLNKEFNKAIKVCNIIKKNDSSLMIYFRLGEIYYYLGDLDKSRAIFQQLDSPLEFKIGSLYYLGMISSQKREIDETQRIVQEISILSPKEYVVFPEKIKLSSIYMAMGKKELGYGYLNSFFNDANAKKMRYVHYKYIDIDKNFDKFKNEEKFINILKNKEIS